MVYPPFCLHPKDHNISEMLVSGVHSGRLSLPPHLHHVPASHCLWQTNTGYFSTSGDLSECASIVYAKPGISELPSFRFLRRLFSWHTLKILGSKLGDCCFLSLNKTSITAHSCWMRLVLGLDKYFTVYDAATLSTLAVASSCRMCHTSYNCFELHLCSCFLSCF